MRTVSAGELSRPLDRENRILALMLEVGADIAEISRRSGIPSQTVRRLYREHIKKRARIRYSREIDFERLGLKGIQFLVTVDPEIEPLFYRDALLHNVWGELYVKSIYRVIPENLFFFNHFAPPAYHQRLRQLYADFEDMGILKVEDTYNCSRLAHPRMWVEDFDFEIPGWAFNWSSLKPPESIEDPPPCEPVRLDKQDILMVNEYQFDFEQSVAAVAAKAKLSRPVGSWHFRRHVEGRGLLGRHVISWLGTRRDDKTGVVPQRQSFVGIDFIAKDLSASERMNVRAHLHSIPYLWSEKIGESDYDAEVFIPAHSLMEALKFFAKILRPLEGRARMLTADQSFSSTLLINPGLFDAESRRWVYKGDLVVEGMRKSLAGGMLGRDWKKQEEGEPA